MRDPIQEQWADFISAIREEFTAHGRDSSILRVDSVALKVYLPISGGTDHTETFDTRAVLSGNAHEKAARLYHRYEEAARMKGGPRPDAEDRIAGLPGWTNAFSKKAEHHAHAVSLFFLYYNYCRPHQTLTKAAQGVKTTPAMTAGLTDRMWTVDDIVAIMDPETARIE